jgi:hypothetical protein
MCSVFTDKNMHKKVTYFEQFRKKRISFALEITEV